MVSMLEPGPRSQARVFSAWQTCWDSVYHDISRTELNEHSLPRFNMPLELGLFLGASRFGQLEEDLSEVDPIFQIPA